MRVDKFRFRCINVSVHSLFSFLNLSHLGPRPNFSLIDVSIINCFIWSQSVKPSEDNSTTWLWQSRCTLYLSFGIARVTSVTIHPSTVSFAVVIDVHFCHLPRIIKSFKEFLNTTHTLEILKRSIRIVCLNKCSLCIIECMNVYCTVLSMWMCMRTVSNEIIRIERQFVFLVNFFLFFFYLICTLQFVQLDIR